MKRMISLILLAMSLPAHAAESFQGVLDCMRGNLPTTARVQQLELVSEDRAGGSRMLKGNLYATQDEGLLRLTLRLTDPPDMAGSAYLLRESDGTREDDVYLSLPKVTRVRHITGKQASQSLFGTDFNYADVKQIQNAFSGGEGKLEGKDEIDDRAVDIISMQPSKKSESPYSLIRAWVDQASCVALKTEFYEGKDKLRKRLTGPADSIVQTSGKHWYLSTLVMEDLKNETKTTLKMDRVIDVEGLSKRYFNPNTFNVGN